MYRRTWVERVTIAQAAKQLGVTQEAIRARIRRGSMESHKGEDGRTYVYLTDQESVANDVSNDYINALKSQIASLEKDRDEWREEAKRHQHIIMTLSQRFPTPDQQQPQESIAFKELTEAGLEITNLALREISKYTKLLKRA
jgi:predicted ArsR family transcriptional regulator